MIVDLYFQHAAAQALWNGATARVASLEHALKQLREKQTNRPMSTEPYVEIHKLLEKELEEAQSQVDRNKWLTQFMAQKIKETKERGAKLDELAAISQDAGGYSELE